MKIVTIQFEFSLKHYDYLLDEKIGFTAEKGMRLKKVRGFSKWGPTYGYLTIVDIQETTLDTFPAHVTSLMVVDKDHIISTYKINKDVLEMINCKYTIGSRGTQDLAKDISAMKHMAYLYAASVVSASNELSTVYYGSEIFQTKVEELKGYQKSLLDTIKEIYQKNDKHIRLDKRDCVADYFANKAINSTDSEAIEHNDSILLSTLLSSLTKKDYACWEPNWY